MFWILKGIEFLILKFVGFHFFKIKIYMYFNVNKESDPKIKGSEIQVAQIRTFIKIQIPKIQWKKIQASEIETKQNSGCWNSNGEILSQNLEPPKLEPKTLRLEHPGYKYI